VAQAAYDCDWCDAPASFRTSLIMIMMRAQKPVKLTAWKFFEVDLEMFITVNSITYIFYFF
jgi:hypothetical protein